MSVAGAFYPLECKQVEEMILEFNKILSQVELPSIKPKAIISPHAGYIYSGFTANVGFRVLANRTPKRIVVVGPSHRVYLEGVSGSFYDLYETPCGALEIDTKFLEELALKFEIKFLPNAHLEHSTETQMPFIKHYFPDAKVVELVYGDIAPLTLAKMFKEILKDEENAIVISTDLSHYYPLKQAEALDMHCIKAVYELSLEELASCEACGKLGVAGMIISAKELGLKSKVLDYRTSADASGDKSAVVGYMSAAFY